MSDSLTGLLVDAELAAFVEASRATPGPLARQLGPRAMREAQRHRVMARPRGPELAVVEDLAAADGVAVRLYRPASGPHALVVFLHGGMWTIGDLESHDRACRRLAAGAGVAVLAVDVRRAPGHPWPAAVDDAIGVVRWAFDRLPPALIVTAEHDPLRDEGELFASRLAAAGVPVQHRREPRMIHGFLTLDTVSPAAAQAGERFFADVSRLAATVV